MIPKSPSTVKSELSANTPIPLVPFTIISSVPVPFKVKVPPWELVAPRRTPVPSSPTVIFFPELWSISTLTLALGVEISLLAKIPTDLSPVAFTSPVFFISIACVVSPPLIP